MRIKAFVLAALLAGCGGGNESTGSSGSSGAGGTGGSSGDAGTGPTPKDAKEPEYADCGGAIFDKSGKLNPAEYRRQAILWDRETIDCRLGPTFEELNPGAADDRPEAYEPAHQSNPGGYLCKTFELSGTCNGNCDYGSTSGQMLYAPDDKADPGVDRVQTYGYESGHICESPQTGDYLGGPHPDPALVQWAAELGRALVLPNGFSQSEMWETNGGIMIFPDGLVGGTGNQTSGGSNPKTLLPEGKVPTAVSVTLFNEFALVTLWDTLELKAQVAVFALRADSPGAFSVPYYGLPNEAGYKNIQLLGYVDLPDMVAPTGIAANGNNGSTPGGHVIGFEFGQKMDDPAVRQAFSRDDYERWVPTLGHAVVISRWEEKATFLDLTPLFKFLRKVYFGTEEDWQKAKAQDNWPFSFESNPEMKPTVIKTVTVAKPSAVRVGTQPGGSFEDGLLLPLKAWVSGQDGMVHVYDINGFAEEARPVPPDGIKEIGTVNAGGNITSMSLLGYKRWNAAIVANRGARAIQWITTSEQSFDVTRTLTDKRLGDPVRVDANDRGPVVTAADFHGKKIITFRTGATEENGGKPPAGYGCGDGGSDAMCEKFELGGELAAPGTPFFVGTTNVN